MVERSTAARLDPFVPARAAWRPGPRLQRISAAALPCVVPLLLLFFWQVAATEGWLAVQILPPPAMVFETFVGLIRDGTIEQGLAISLARITIGFVAGTAAGLAFGVLLGVSDRIERYLGPLFRAVAQIPSLGWLPLLILIFGLGEPLKYIIIAKACFVPMVLNTSAGIRSVPASYNDVARVFRLRRSTLLLKLVMPAALPSIFTGIRTAVNHGWIALVVVEMLAATEGVGYMMVWGRTLFQIDVVIVGMIVIGIIGFLIDCGLKWIERRLRRGAVAPTSPAATAGRGGVWRGFVVPVALLILWGVAAHIHPGRLLVPVECVALVPFADADGINLWPALGASLMRAMTGFVIGAFAGLLVGLIMGMSRSANQIVGPSFHALRQVTLFAWIPLLTAWFGSGEEAKLVFVALSAFFPMALNTYIGLRNLPDAYLEVAQVLRLSPRRRILRLLLPGAMPAIVTGLELSLLLAWIGTVGAEYATGLGLGLGSFIAAARTQFRVDIVIVGVLTLSVIGYLLNFALRAMIDRVLPWSEQCR